MTRLSIVPDVHMRAGHVPRVTEELTAVVDRLAERDVDHAFVLGDLIGDGRTAAIGGGNVERVRDLFDDAPFPVTYVLGNHAVEDLRYDHPDRKVVRGLYHEIREGEVIRLLVGTDLHDETFVITPDDLDSDLEGILERFVHDMRSEPGEWAAIAAELDEWRGDVDSKPEVRVAFRYLQ
jgi:hypothetical protein